MLWRVDAVECDFLDLSLVKDFRASAKFVAQGAKLGASTSFMAPSHQEDRVA